MSTLSPPIGWKKEVVSESRVVLPNYRTAVGRRGSMKQRRSTRYRPPKPPRGVRSVIYGPQDEIIYQGVEPEEAARLWGRYA